MSGIGLGRFWDGFGMVSPTMSGGVGKSEISKIGGRALFIIYSMTLDPNNTLKNNDFK